MEQKIQQKNLQDSVILKPFSKEIEKEYLRASIYTMSSYAEGFGMVLVESASFGLPSVAFDINTGPSDIIENGVSGFLVTDGDLGEYARALEKLMGNEELRREMGAKAKMIVEDKRTKEFFEKNKENLAFVVFYSGKNQEGYRNQKAIYDVIEGKYGIEAKYIDLDTNPDLIQRFNLTAFPENFFVYRNSKNEAIWHRVKAGHATLNTIVDTTIFLFDNAILEEDK